MLKKQAIQSEIPATPMRYLGYLLKDSRLPAIITVLVVTAAEIIETSVPYIFRKIVDSAELYAAGVGDIRHVWLWGLSFPLVMAVVFVLWRTSGFTGMKWITEANARSYQVLFYH